MSWNAYRLRRRDNPLLRPRSGPHGYAEKAAWLAPGVLWVEGWLTSSSHRPLHCQVELEGHTLEGEAHRFTHARPDLETLPGATGQVFVVSLRPLPEDFADRDCQTLRRLLLRLDDTWYRLTGSHDLAIAPDLEASLPLKVPHLAPEAREGLAAFLDGLGPELGLDDESLFERHRALGATLLLPSSPEVEPDGEAPGAADVLDSAEALAAADSENGQAPESSTPLPLAHGEESGAVPNLEETPGPDPAATVDAPSADASDAIEPSESLSDDATSAHDEAEVETDSVETPIQVDSLPTSIADPTSPVGLAIDRMLALDSETLLLQGWHWDRDRPQGTLRLRTPEPGSEQGLEDLWLSPRHDVAEFFAPSFGPVPADDLGFLALARLPDLADGTPFLLECVLGDDAPLRIAAPRAIDDPVIARRLLLEMVQPLGHQPELFARFVEPALARLQPALLEASTLETVVEHGTDRRPTVSLFVAVGSDLEIVEHQMASFSGDPVFDHTEILYWLDEPEHRERFVTRLHHLARLYDLPVRGLVADRPLGLATGIQQLTQLARGDCWVLLAVDTLAAGPGWLDTLEATARGPRTGVVGAKLLSEDRSIAHSGIDWRQGIDPHSRWAPEDAFLGFHAQWEPTTHEREVTAVAGACLAITAETFEAVGGIDGLYLGGTHEDFDLGLRCRREGLINRVVPEALFHLGGLGRPTGARWDLDPWGEHYNRWRFDRRWSDFLDSLDA